MQCWRWLVDDHPNVPVALVCEDDACFDGGRFGHEWRTTVLPLLAHPDRWDCLLLGYFSDSGPATIRPIRTDAAVVNTKTLPTFFGSHAYLVTQRGARILLQHAFPMDHQVDGYFLTLQELGLLRFSLLLRSVVSQCMNNVDRGGSWHTHRINCPWSGRPWAIACLLSLLLLCVVGW